MNEYDLDILKLAGQGYCCSQIVMKLGLDVQGVDNPGLVRAVSGLCYGVSGDSTCGALTGAACLIGYFSSKGDACTNGDERLPKMLAALYGWFESYCSGKFSGTSCHAIVGEEGKIDRAVCGELVSMCYGRAVTILVENGCNPDGSGEF